MEQCQKEIDGDIIYGRCCLPRGHDGPHAFPIDWFDWEDSDYCTFPGCKFLSFHKSNCGRHQGEA